MCRDVPLVIKMNGTMMGGGICCESEKNKESKDKLRAYLSLTFLKIIIIKKVR